MPCTCLVRKSEIRYLQKTREGKVIQTGRKENLMCDDPFLKKGRGVKTLENSRPFIVRGNIKKKRAFSLSEILIGIAVIAILAALIVPVANRAIDSAKSAACISRLKALGGAFMAYQADRQHLIPGDDSAFAFPENVTWLAALRDYCDLDALRSCPSAPKPGGNDLNNGDGNNKWGSWRHAWSLGAGSWMLPPGDPGYSSYGMNMWTRWKFLDSSPIESERASFGSTRVDESSKIPLIMDARWEGLWPVPTDPLPSSGSLHNAREIPITGSNWRMVDNVAMLRHGDGVNICFLDGSVRHVSVNDLWTLKWNKNYESRGVLDLL